VSAGAGNRPVYRYAPRSHVYNCPCSRCVQVRTRNAGSYGAGLGIILGLLLGWLVLCWPALVWHGYGGPAGTAWRWDVHSTVACAVWWGVLVSAVFAGWLADRVGKRPVSPAVRPAGPVAQGPPVCVHSAAVPVDNDTLGRLAWWCPGCETQLGAGFIPPRRTCCGTAARDPHLWNCPTRMTAVKAAS
jgi:hypothetical protein